MDFDTVDKLSIKVDNTIIKFTSIFDRNSFISVYSKYLDLGLIHSKCNLHTGSGYIMTDGGLVILKQYESKSKFNLKHQYDLLDVPDNLQCNIVDNFESRSVIVRGKSHGFKSSPSQSYTTPVYIKSNSKLVYVKSGLTCDSTLRVIHLFECLNGIEYTWKGCKSDYEIFDR